MTCKSLFSGEIRKYYQFVFWRICPKGVVGCGEGVVYLTSMGCPHDIAYSWARLAILVAGKGRGALFIFLLFLHFHSCSSFFPVPLFHLLYYLFFSLSLGDNKK